MRNLNLFNKYRRTDRHVLENWGWIGDETAGMFMIPSPIDQKPLSVVATVGSGWDHISVSRATRCPNWPEMEFIAWMLFGVDECAMQLHVPPTDHVNNHPYCLHWWRPHDVPIPRPPTIMVGIADLGILNADSVKKARAEADWLAEL